MKYKTIKYETIKAKLSKEANISLEDVEKSIRLAVYMAMVNGNDIAEKFEIVESGIVEYFQLDKLLSDSEVDYVFEQVIGSDEREVDFSSLTFKDIQTYCLVFVASVEDIDLRYALFDLLEELSLVNGEASDDEAIVLSTYAELFNSSIMYEDYQPILKKIDEYRSNYIYARNGEYSKGFSKKLSKALKTYGTGLIEDDVVALYDSTIFGGADEGFLITKYAILTTQDQDYSVIPFSAIYSVVYDDDAMRFFAKKVEGEEAIEIGTLPRTDNLRILVNILAQIAEVNIVEDGKEEAIMK